MDIPPLHPWSLSQSDAVALQKRLAASVETDTPLGDYELVAGADGS